MSDQEPPVVFLDAVKAGDPMPTSSKEQAINMLTQILEDVKADKVSGWAIAAFGTGESAEHVKSGIGMSAIMTAKAITVLAGRGLSCDCGHEMCNTRFAQRAICDLAYQYATTGAVTAVVMTQEQAEEAGLMKSEKPTTLN